MEAPPKFRAPDVTLRIGRLVLRALNRVEVGLLIVVVVSVVAAPRLLVVWLAEPAVGSGAGGERTRPAPGRTWCASHWRWSVGRDGVGRAAVVTSEPFHGVAVSLSVGGVGDAIRGPGA